MIDSGLGWQMVYYVNGALMESRELYLHIYFSIILSFDCIVRNKKNNFNEKNSFKTVLIRINMFYLEAIKWFLGRR